MARRKMLEDTPIPSTNEDAVVFDTSEIPWWAWVRRFHLPEAEKLNGRAAMVGYFMALFVDQLTGVGLLDQQNSFFGKLLLHVAVFGILFIRTSSGEALRRARCLPPRSPTSLRGLTATRPCLARPRARFNRASGATSSIPLLAFLSTPRLLLLPLLLPQTWTSSRA